MRRAQAHGVEREVLESLRSLRLEDWSSSGRYMISRALIHGRRRAEEMREAARTVEEAGFEPRMSGACAGWQEWAGEHGAAASRQDLEAMLDALLSKQSGEAA